MESATASRSVLPVSMYWMTREKELPVPGQAANRSADKVSSTSAGEPTLRFCLAIQFLEKSGGIAEMWPSAMGEKAGKAGFAVQEVVPCSKPPFTRSSSAVVTAEDAIRAASAKLAATWAFVFMMMKVRMVRMSAMHGLLYSKP